MEEFSNSKERLISRDEAIARFGKEAVELSEKETIHNYAVGYNAGYEYGYRLAFGNNTVDSLNNEEHTASWKNGWSNGYQAGLSRGNKDLLSIKSSGTENKSFEPKENFGEEMYAPRQAMIEDDMGNTRGGKVKCTTMKKIQEVV